MQSENSTPKLPIETIPTNRRSIAGAWIAFGLILAVLLGVAGLIAYRLNIQDLPADLPPELHQEHPLFPPGVSLKPVDKPVIGNLGGMPVTFPDQSRSVWNRSCLSPTWAARFPDGSSLHTSIGSESAMGGGFGGFPAV